MASMIGRTLRHQHEGEEIMFTRLTIGGLVAAAAVTLLGARAGGVRAQYPPPEGSCTIATSSTTPDPHSSVAVAVTVLDINGNAVPGVATGLSISRQPGTDASLSGIAPATDSSGVAKGALQVGTSSGVIGLSAHTDVVFCAATVVVGQGAVLAAVNLPDTGTGPATHGDASAALVALVMGSLGIVAVGSALNWRRARHG
jgi:hypothetical protein